VASDFIVNLRYPSGGESSGTLSRAMGLGLACVVVNIGPFAEIPDECAVKLNYDENFDSSLNKALMQLISDKKARVQIGLNGRRWVESTQDIGVTTQAYLDVITQVTKRISAQNKSMSTASVSNSTHWLEYLPLAQVRAFTCNNKSQLRSLTDGTNHWWAQSLLPVYADTSLLMVSETRNVVSLAEMLLSYPEEATCFINVEEFALAPKQAATFAFERFVLNLPLRLIEADPVAVFCQMNTLLQMGAIGCVTLCWDSKIENEVELTRTSIIHYLEAAGFSVDRIITGTPDIDLNASVKPEFAYQQEWCFSLTKCSRMVNMNPQPYYSGACSALKLLTIDSVGPQRVTAGDKHDV
jgi:hypothetical protein